VCGSVSAVLGYVGKENAAIRIAVLRDLGNLAPRTPCWRSGIYSGTFLGNRVADRFGYALIKTVWKQ
jgi:hypothetical protein